MSTTTRTAALALLMLAGACGGRMPAEQKLASGVYARRALLDDAAVYWVDASGYGNQLPSYEVRKLPKTGGPPSTVAKIELEAPEEQHHSLAALVAATRRYVYFTSRSTSRLFRAPKAGGAVEELHVLGPPYRHVTITALAGDEQGVFVMQQKHPLAAADVKVTPGLVFVDDDSPSAKLLAADACGEHVAADGHDVFWTESSSDNYIPCKGGRLLKLSKSGAEKPVVVAGRRNQLGALIRVSTEIFFTDNWGLERTPKAATDAAPTLVTQYFGADRMAIGAKRAVGIRDLAYPGTGPEQEVVIATLAGGKPEKLAAMPKLSGAIVSDGSSAYWFRSTPKDRNDTGLYRFTLE